MSKMVFKLSSVSEEESEGVKKALDDQNITYYETPGSAWGWSMPAIWVKDNEDFDAAREAIEQFQTQYLNQLRNSTTQLESDKKLNPMVILIIVLAGIAMYSWIIDWF